ncbi:GT-D fold domain-containing glycosyltransferase [Agromyces larvae]|uniref:GT-D fold domain-containing glycosyltransferase n=1 Tax=Agromyces larvae TaxID=2929802 RepID=A0ABY4BZX4_9MICO|nr:GT-D fold domain-containing glycosyltransferase [Agromyces larvae]UOE44309.1 GT-D fold domain-containing glycosyltransferase [Agromyces larvae]
MSATDTLIAVHRERLSLARFGDGELGMMLNPKLSIPFQTNSPDLAQDLRTTLAEPAENLLLCLPSTYNLKRSANPRMAARWWTRHGSRILQLIPESATRFGDQMVSRMWFFEEYGQDAVRLWRDIWDGRQALVVTGEGSRFELLDELFDNLQSADYLFSVAKDAYADLDRVVDEVQKRSPDLVLISLGVAGTVLAHRLARVGVQALDIGHLSASWNYVYKDGQRPEAMPVWTGQANN